VLHIILYIVEHGEKRTIETEPVRITIRTPGIKCGLQEKR
jgi:hypothetical protein